MAYNLQSLITILQQVLDPEQTRWIRFQNIPQLQSLLEKAESLQQILEKSSSLSKTKSLENQIRDAAHRVEDLIEPLMVDQMLSLPQGISFTSLAPDMEQVTQELDYVMKQVVKLVEGNNIMSSGSSSSGTSFSSVKSVVVGVDEDLMQLKDRLTGTERKLEIIPIVGMGGIGKTTLARSLYQDPYIVSHFKYLAWTTISQDYNMKAILSSLLRCIIGKEFDEQHIEKEVDELRDVLYRSLYGRKFMIVLDDIWSTKFWDEIKVYLPNNKNGSRIVITTRELDVAKYADSRSLEHQVQLLSDSKSWDLLCQIVFGEDDCSDHILQGIGERIASDCGGLPLAINVIGGFLSKLQRSRDIWENIAKDVRGAIVEKDEQCFNILSLSYNHLSNQLRPCFLYMGAAFPEDFEIKGSRLVRMWIAEGFVEANVDQSLEDVAEDYLKGLVERNLVLAKELKRDGKRKKRYSMHDLLRNLCISKANDDKFLQVKNAGNALTVSSNTRRVCFDAPYSPHHEYDSTEMMPHIRSFLSTGTKILSPVLFAFRLLRVLHILEMKFQEFPTEVLQLVNLRYLAISFKNSSLPIGISRLCNLQTLIANVEWGSAPCEIWEMSELRHIKLNRPFRFEEDDMKKHVLEKLLTLSSVGIDGSQMWKDFFQRFPNIKKLAIFYVEEFGEVVDLTHLYKLEKLTCTYRYVMSRHRFPSSLKSLTLGKGSISSRELSTLCDLPNLEALMIHACDFERDEDKEEEYWELAEDDEFRSLRYLHLEYCSLAQWRAYETNFPRLCHLSIAYCYHLQEIPSSIGEILTLQLIDMYSCRATAVASAKQIQEVQQSEYGNYDLQLHIHEE